MDLYGLLPVGDDAHIVPYEIDPVKSPSVDVFHVFTTHVIIQIFSKKLLTNLHSYAIIKKLPKTAGTNLNPAEVR